MIRAVPLSSARVSSRVFVTWTLIAIVSEAAMLWGLLSTGVASKIGVNVGFFGMLGVAAGAARRVPRALRAGPPALGTAIVSAGVGAHWWLRRDEGVLSAFSTVLMLLALMIAIVGAIFSLSRRGRIVETRLRTSLVLAMVIWMSVSALISFPVGVAKGWMGLAELIVLFAILLWPARRTRPPA